MRGSDGYDLHARHLNPVLPRMLHTIGFDTVYERGSGAYLYDRDGTAYLDLLAGFGVFALGRHHRVLRDALHQVLDLDLADLAQMDTPLLEGVLAEELLKRAPGLDRAYFCNSGTEAVEAALKFARAATKRSRILFCDHAFHGLTAGSLSVNGGHEFRSGFGPLLPDTCIPFGDLAALERELSRGDVAALVVEPIQGKGVRVVPPGFLESAADLLHDHGALLICDEVQTGVGRTGSFFAYQHEPTVQPDIVTVAKALSGGYVPVGATLAKDWVFRRVYSSMDKVMVHSSTFGGNALAMTAGLATLAVIEDEQLVDRAQRMGALLQSELAAMAERFELIVDIRGRGLMIGIEFGQPQSRSLRRRWTVLQAARRGLFAQMVVGALYRQHHVLTQVAADHLEVIKLLPPLTIGEREITCFVEALTEVMESAGRGGLMKDFGRTLIRQAMKT